MEFLVRMDLGLPPDLDDERRCELVAGEAAAARRLAAAGILRRVWRVPGRRSNVGIWEAPDAGSLHEALASLPFFGWLDITVEPMAPHPNDPGPAGFGERPGETSL